MSNNKVLVKLKRDINLEYPTVGMAVTAGVVELAGAGAGAGSGPGGGPADGLTEHLPGSTIWYAVGLQSLQTSV